MADHSVSWSVTAETTSEIVEVEMLVTKPDRVRLTITGADGIRVSASIDPQQLLNLAQKAFLAHKELA